MMQGQHKIKLTSFYEEKIRDAKKHLEKKFPLKPCTSDDEDYPPNIDDNSWIVWKINTEKAEYSFNLLIAIPNTFPDYLPKIYLSKKDYEKVCPIPHVDVNRFICTRDENVVFFDDDKAEEALEELINIAVDDILIKGIKKENEEDFIEEFLAYWNNESKFTFLSIFTPNEKIERLKVVTLSKKFLGCDNLVAQTIEKAEKWLSPFLVKIDKESTFNALYIPFDSPPNNLFPRSNNEILRIIQSSCKSHISTISRFFSENESNLIILFSFPIKNERIFAGWRHKSWSKEIFKGGFRGKRLPIEIRLQRSSSHIIDNIQIDRLDKTRLFDRAGKGIEKMVGDTSVVIIGCGSVGSPLAMSLSKCGISKFILIDKENLSSENVPRHLCGFNEVDKKLTKSDAVGKRIQQHFPHIDSTSYSEDILDLVQKKPDILNKTDLIIIATGHPSIERRLNFLLKKQMISSPVLFLWIEPFGVAGQILYIHPYEGGCYQCCFNSDGHFKYSVAKHNNAFFKRECGCQNIFTQYSGLDVDHFVCTASRKVLDFLERQPTKSILYTWLGDLKYFKKSGYKINDSWLADSSFSIHQTIFSKDNDCKICSK